MFTLKISFPKLSLTQEEFASINIGKKLPYLLENFDYSVSMSNDPNEITFSSEEIKQIRYRLRELKEIRSPIKKKRKEK